MKRFTIVFAITIIAGCGTSKPPIMRTGKICIEPISTTGYSTSDPIDIRPDVVNQVATMIQSELVNQMGKESNLIYVTDCAGSDLILAAKLKNLDAKTESKHIAILAKSKIKREYSAGVVAHLSTSAGKPVVNNIFVSEEDDNLNEVVEHVAENIIKEIREVK